MMEVAMQARERMFDAADAWRLALDLLIEAESKGRLPTQLEKDKERAEFLVYARAQKECMAAVMAAKHCWLNLQNLGGGENTHSHASHA